MAARAEQAISPDILEQAADWLVQLHADGASDEDRRACERWRRAHPEHARAWARAELLMNKLGGMPPQLAMPALGRPRGNTRRAALLKLASLSGALPAGWLGWRLAQAHGWTADHRTAAGQRDSIRLADGSTVVLNTATSIDVAFDADRRTVVLRDGEILITTAPDTMAWARPFRVRTAQGLVRALGTRFTVRQRDGRTEVAVFEHAVRLEPRLLPSSAYRVVHAGQSACFAADAVDSPVDTPAGAGAWTQGLLMVDRMRLADFAAELARYREGVVSCDPAVASVRVSGTFPVNDTDRALAMLAATYPVAARTRLGGYWVRLEPA